MPVIKTPIKDLFLLEPQVFGDERGWFTEKVNMAALAEAGFSDLIVQVNHSFSAKGVLRGLHFQRPPHDQSKIVFCVRGRLFDVAVDVRRGSSTFGRWFGVELSGENRRGLLVPRGFAHGFYALDDCELLYLCGNATYDKASEGGLRWDDPAVGVEWPLEGAPQVNDRDAGLGGLADLQL